MSELFGAPSGIIAADKLRADNTRSREASVKSMLDAQESMGRLALMPYEAAKLTATARNQNAEAIGREQSAADEQALQALESDFSRQDPQAQARQQLAALAASKGQVATVGDLEDGKVPRPKSQADYLERFADYAESRGAPPSQVAKTRKAVADIREKEAIGGYRTAQAAQVQAQQEEKLAERVGRIAAAAAESPQNYMAILGSPQGAKLLPLKQLSGDYEADRPLLEAVAQSSQDALARSREQRETLNSEARRKLEDAQTSKARSDTKVAVDRETRLTQTAEIKAKTVGQQSPEAKEAAKELAAARLATRVAKHLEQHPLMPLDVKSLKPGMTYTMADGRVMRWDLNPATGKYAPNVMDQIPRLPAGAAKQASVAVTANDGEED